MINGYTIYFGYGDISIGHDVTGILEIRQLSEPVDIGETARDKKNEDVKIRMNPFDINISELKQAVYGIKKSFVYKGITFDFSHYNATSLKTVIEAVKKAQEVYGLTRAC